MKLSDKKRETVTVILLIILAFVFGVALATKLTSSYYQKLFDEIELQTPAMNIVKTVHILRNLRDNKIKPAIDYEEWHLDDNIMTLSNHLNDTNINNPQMIKYAHACVRIASKYRTDYPSSLSKTATTRNTINNLFVSSTKLKD